MNSAVVSGRVSQDTKTRVDHVLKKNKLGVGEFIKIIWGYVAQTGELPECALPQKGSTANSKAFDDFEQFVSSLPPAAHEFAIMTEADMKQFLGDEYA